MKRTFAYLAVFLLGAVAFASGISFMMASASSTYNNPPDPPVITGPTSGKTGIEYVYNITLNDPDGDHMEKMEVDFGNGNISMYNCGCKDPPWLPGTTVQISNTWKESGSYTVKAKVMDIYGEWSGWGSLQVTMPKAYHLSLIEKISEWFISITGRSVVPWGK